MMKHLWQRLINKIARKLKSFGTLDSERALRAKNMRILELEQALAQKPPWIDPTIRQRGYEQSAWNSEPERNTDKPTIITPNPRGAYYQQRREEFMETREQPTVSPSRTFTARKLHLQRYQEDAWVR